MASSQLLQAGNCMDKDWPRINDYTPSSPEGLQVSIDTRQDEMGHLHPVLVVNWNIRDDGSVRYLTASELHVLVMSTNLNLCVRYSFEEKLSMRSPTGEKWSLSANMLVDPGQTYQVSVFNIPKTKVGYSPYDVSTNVTTLACPDSKMQMTKFCIERGSLWQPNISLTAVSEKSAVAVNFTPDTLCEEYIVIVSCSTYQDIRRIHKANQKTLNVIFHLVEFPTFCCQFDVEVRELKYFAGIC
ncbi:interleukin-17 receptor A-like isoform 2-T2 [Spinachia spinachia]